MAATVPKEHQFAGQGAVLITAFLWSTSGLFIRLVEWHPMVITGTRALVAAVFMLIVRLLFPSPQSPESAGSLKAGDIKKKSIALPFWISAFANAFVVITFVTANRLTASANAVLLQYSSPVWTALLAWLVLKERPRWEQWGGLLLVIGGMLIFFRDALGAGTLLGDGIAVLSGMFVATHIVFLRMAKDGNPRDVLLMSHVIAFVISIPFIILYPPEFTTTSVGAILFMGLIQQGAASLFFAYGIKRVSAVQAILTSTIEPLCNPLWVFLVLGEGPSASAYGGGALILAAVLSSSIIGNRRKQREAGERRLE